MSEGIIRSILTKYRVVAVVGLSRDPSKASYSVAEYRARDIFRPSDDVPPIVEQAIQLKKAWGKPFVVWMQLGIVSEEAAAKAREAGLTVVMNHCMMQEHKRLFGSSP